MILRNISGGELSILPASIIFESIASNATSIKKMTMGENAKTKTMHVEIIPYGEKEKLKVDNII